MGLDAVEIVISLEQTFELEIPDADAQRLLSPAVVVDYLMRRLPTMPIDHCLTQRTFYQLRRGFEAAIPALATGLTLDTPLKEIVHKDQWPQVWAAIRSHSAAQHWPETVAWPGLLRMGPKTLRELVLNLAMAMPAPAPGQPWTRDEVEYTVRRIIAEESGAMYFPLRKTFAQLGID